MIDVKLIIDADGRFDISFTEGDFTLEDGFDTALYASLFTDARAPANLVPVPEHRRGWMGDIVSPVEGRSLGGLLWLVDQRRLTQDTLNDSISYARKSVKWFIEDKWLNGIDVSGIIVPRSGIRLFVIPTALNGQVGTTRAFDLWKLTGN